MRFFCLNISLTKRESNPLIKQSAQFKQYLGILSERVDEARACETSDGRKKILEGSFFTISLSSLLAKLIDSIVKQAQWMETSSLDDFGASQLLELKQDIVLLVDYKRRIQGGDYEFFLQGVDVDSLYEHMGFVPPNESNVDFSLKNT